MAASKTNNSYFTLLNTDKARLVQFSFLMLFVELTIIRWTGSNIYYLFFFANFVLLASFLGIGIGFLRSKASMDLFNLSPIFLAILIYFSYRYSFQYHLHVNALTDNLDYDNVFFKQNMYPVWLTLPIMFLTVTALMMTIADGVARVFQQFTSLQAYRFEVLGSLSGVIVFSLLSFLHASPLWWGVIICMLYLSLLNKQWHWRNVILKALQLLALATVLVTFGKETLTPNHFWSAYYKIAVQAFSDNRYVVNVNGLAQQVIESVAQRKKVKPFYFQPYEHTVRRDKLDNVLVIGAGTGGDVAIALAQGAKHVDAVEIDPVLYSLGKKLNPDQPYADPRVNIYINDGRAFLQQSINRYDMIIFALTDSLMLIPGQSSLRLENYLYTLEGISAAAKHLKPGGVFTIYNYYRLNWFINRLANTLALAFKQTPCIDTYGADDYWAMVLTASLTPSALQCPTKWQAISNHVAAPSTDDHPFMYLEENNLPTLYLATLLFIFCVTIGIMMFMNKSFGAIKDHPDLFFMGTAFLLLETKNIVNFALFFGATWLVNALVFVGIMTTVYLAVEVTHHVKRLEPTLLYFILIGSLLLTWFVPNSVILSLPILWRFVAATFLAFSPIFVANLIFAERFQQTSHSRQAFGANLIGAVLGGLLEYSSLIIGYHSLLLLIITLYVGAIVLMRVTANSIAEHV